MQNPLRRHLPTSLELSILLQLLYSNYPTSTNPTQPTLLTYSTTQLHPVSVPSQAIPHAIRFRSRDQCKLGRIIRLKNIIRKYSVFVSLFGTRIGSKQASLFVSYKKQIPFLKSNNVKYCRILSNSVHFGTFLSHFYMLFALFDFNK